jgi:hypothetical protein
LWVQIEPMTQLLFLFLACTGTDDSAKDSGDSPEDSVADSEDTDTGTDSEKESSGGDDSGDSNHSDDSQPDSGDDSGPDSGGDSGDSSPPDSGDSSPPDSGGDSGDSGGDSGDSGGAACTDADLVWTAEVRDATGAAGTVFSPRQPLTVVGVVSNPCSSDVTITTPDSCLVNGYSVTDSRGQGMGVAVACAAVLTDWVVPAGGSVEESTAFGRLTPESYVLDVSFNYGNHVASQAFVVQ